MKTTPIIRCGLAAITLGLASAAAAEPATYEVDEEHLAVGFMIKHLGYADTLGQFLEAEGSFVYDEAANELESGEFVVQADSVFTGHERRDKHVRGDDFLAAGDHQTIRFEATHWQPADDDPRRGRLDGELTLLGKTRPVSLEVTINKAAEYPFGHRKYTLGISARTTIKRSEWGMDYGVDENLVGDEVKLIFEFEAIRQ